MKRLLCLLFSLALILSSSSIVFANDGKGHSETKKGNSDNESKSSNSSVIKYDKFIIPTKAIINGLGAKLDYNTGTHTLTVTKDANIIIMILDKKLVFVNGKEIKPNVLTEKKYNSALVLVKFISQTLKYKATTHDVSDIGEIEKIIINVNDNIIGNGVNQFEYAGVWAYNNQTTPSAIDYHWSNSTNAYSQIKFEGKQIKLYGIKDIGNGIAAVSIDGAPGTKVDCYANTRRENALLYTSPELSNGQHTLKITVTGSKNEKSANFFIMLDKVEIKTEVVKTETNTDATKVNLALNKTVVASSSDDASRIAANAVDGKADTCWYSHYSDPQWIYVDLGSVQNISRVRLSWEVAYGKSYKIQVSNDAAVWTDVFTTANSNGGIDDISFLLTGTRYVRVYGTERSTIWGYSLKELEVYN